MMTATIKFILLFAENKLILLNLPRETKINFLS